MAQGDRVPSFCETDKRVSVERLRQGNGHGLYSNYLVSGEKFWIRASNISCSLVRIAHP